MEFPVILVSDDDPSLVSALSRQATLAGMWVLPDLTSQADVLARQFRPDLVILDLNQKVNGCELLARLRQDPATAGHERDLGGWSLLARTVRVRELPGAGHHFPRTHPAETAVVVRAVAERRTNGKERL